MNARLALSLAAFVACASPAADSPVDTDPGTQIGGIDCEYDKLFLDVVDEASQPVAAEATATFPSGDAATVQCGTSGCQIELDGPGSYTLDVDAGTAGRASQGFTLDDTTVAGNVGGECGGHDFHEISLQVQVETGGDILTSNIGLRAYDSGGSQVGGSATITPRGASAWTRTCGAHRCWIDIDGTGVYAIDFVSGAGETASVQVSVDASHLIGVNELGDDVYELDVDVHLTP